MSETKHTPGPWRQRGSSVRATFVDGQDHSLAQVWGETVNGSSREEQLANAKLIAAAPELLAALEDIVDRNEIQNWFNLDRARAAIAAAE